MFEHIILCVQAMYMACMSGTKGDNNKQDNDCLASFICDPTSSCDLNRSEPDTIFTLSICIFHSKI